MVDDAFRVEAFFLKLRAWRDEMLALRAILRDEGLAETFKWSAPCYTWEGANVATIWGFRDSCALSFFKGVLLEDPDGILDAPGQNSRSVRMVRFTGLAEITGMEPALRNHVRNAVAVEKAGLKVDLPKDDLTYPEELTDRLNGDPELRAAFDALTPGRRRGYLLHFSQARQAKTRAARIEKSAPRILAGKGLHDR